MNKNDLLRQGGNFIRVIEMDGKSPLIIDCIKKTMPVWVKLEQLEGYSKCTTKELCQATGFSISDIDTLDSEQRKTMYEHYTMIAPILPYIADEKVRAQLIRSVAEEHDISTQTIRSYL